jgi:hypothetical protein
MGIAAESAWTTTLRNSRMREQHSKAHYARDDQQARCDRSREFDHAPLQPDLRIHDDQRATGDSNRRHAGFGCVIEGIYRFVWNNRLVFLNVLGV